MILYKNLVLGTQNVFLTENFIFLQPFTKYLRSTLASMWNSALHDKFDFFLSRVFC